MSTNPPSARSTWPPPIQYDRLDTSEETVLKLLRGEFPKPQALVNAEDILSLILYHRIHPSIRATLSRQSALLPQWANELEQCLLECCLFETQTWRRKETQASRIAQAFGERNIDGLFIKGYALAKAVYPDPLQRAFGDIDIWVAPEEFRAASEALRSIGFRPQPIHRWGDSAEQTFLEGVTMEASGAGESPIEVDLHWAFTGKTGLQRFVQLDMAAIRARGTCIQPGMRFAKTEDELVLEACHLVRSSFCPLSAFVDLQQLTAKNPDWATVWRDAKAAGVATALGLGLSMSAALLGYDLPNAAKPSLPLPRWQSALLLPRLAPEKLVRRGRLHEFGARFALKLFCQDRFARVLASLALAPLHLGTRLARGLLPSHPAS